MLADQMYFYVATQSKLHLQESEVRDTKITCKISNGNNKNKSKAISKPISTAKD